MKNFEKTHFLKKHIDFILVLAVLAVSSLCFAFDVFHRLELKAYDFMLGLQKNIKTAKNLVFVEIDNESISKIGDWPWTRDILGNSLLQMKELGAKTAVFDIEYLSPSSSSINSKAQKKSDEIFEEEAKTIADVISQMTSAVSQGFYSPSELPELSNVMIDEYINPSILNMKNASSLIVRDNDDYFARCIEFFGNAYLTINMRDMGISRTQEEQNYASERFLLDSNCVIDKNELIKKGNKKTILEESSTKNESKILGFTPALDIFMKHAHGAGFTNAFIDADGTRRRIELLAEKNGKYTCQLSFAPILEYLDVKKIERKGSYLVLKDAKKIDSDGNLLDFRQDIKIPLDKNGRMLINWYHSVYKDSFSPQHESIQFLLKLGEMEENIFSAISVIAGMRVPSETGDDMPYYTEANDILEYKEYLEGRKDDLLSKCYGFDEQGEPFSKESINSNEISAYFLEKREYLDYVSRFLSKGHLEEILSMLDFYNDGTNSTYIEDWKERFFTIFDVLESEYKEYTADFNEMQKIYGGAICFLGFTASASTDLGVMPFDKAYANLGTHINAANTILQQDFIHSVYEWHGASALFVFAVALCAVIIIISHRLPPAKRNNIGIIYALLPSFLGFVLMVFFKVYVPVVLPLSYCIMLYAAELIYNFASVEGDKKFLQTTFGAYVAPAVVEQIVKNPNLARLGGKSENLTALFSDVASFSGFTETINNEELEKTKKENAALPPLEQKSAEEVALLGASRGAERLVSVLNEYLGVLSDAIMDSGGTIDKYVGDEIVSFFGAPIPDENNAFNACVAAIRMIQAEKKYNEEHKNILPTIKENGVDTKKPFYLHSRVGLNTGSMVVGNMGTDKKLNYTIMGNNVNLASRLEGTNKVYGSWIMISESTYLAANRGENKGRIVARALDFVRVINVKKPVRIYSVIGLKNELSEEQIKATEIFNQGMEWYLKGADTPYIKKNPDDLKKAYYLYKKAFELSPEDKSSAYFMTRCEDFLKNGLPDVWDGVFTMKTK